MQALGTIHHHMAGLSDDEARRLEGEAREFYKRVLLLVHATGCDIRIAIEAVATAVEQERGR